MKIYRFLFLLLFPASAFCSDMSTVYPARLLSITDGDTIKVQATIWPNLYKETSVRIYGIDTPEIHGKCEQEKSLAASAREFVADKLTTADAIFIQNVTKDKYGNRVVADVLYKKNNRTYNMAKELIKQNLAVEYFGKTKNKNWCE